MYHIGLPLLCVNNKNVIVKVNPMNCRELKYLNLTEFVHALIRDPDLANINPYMSYKCCSYHQVAITFHLLVTLAKQGF